MINSRSHTPLPPPAPSAKTKHCPLIPCHIALQCTSDSPSTKNNIWGDAWEVTSSFTFAWPAKYLFTNTLFKPELSVMRSRHGSSAFQCDSNFHRLGWTHLYVRHLQFATYAGNTSIALKQEMGVTASPWLKFCFVILPRLNLGFCNVNALPSYYWPKMKTRPMQLIVPSWAMTLAETKLDWLDFLIWTVEKGIRRGFEQTRSADYKAPEATTVTAGWVVKNDRQN